MVERIKTGIPGLDVLIEGGIPKKFVIFIEGPSGAGKTTFSTQFLVYGARNNEPGVFVTMEEEIESIKENASQYGWNLEELEKNKVLKIIKAELYDFDKFVSRIDDAIMEIKAKRVVVDSISFIETYFQDPFKIKKTLLDLMRYFKSRDCTTFIVGEAGTDIDSTSKYGVEEYLSDGVIKLLYFRESTIFLRGTTIRKMRLTKHSMKIHPSKIDSKVGYVVFPYEELILEF